MAKERKIFFVVASGGHGTDRHYVDTIVKKRTLDEARQFLSSSESEELAGVMHGQPFAVWGAAPGSGNIRNWESMEPGDYVLIYRGGNIILAAEVALKIRNPKLAERYWGFDTDGKTWEYIYFLINDIAVDVPIGKLNELLGYKPVYAPRGFGAIESTKSQKFLSQYGDVLSIVQRLKSGQKPEPIQAEVIKQIDEKIEKKLERATTEHDEMQWRLIRLGNRANFDVWVPAADQHKSFEGNNFYDHVIHKFHDVLDVPLQIKNIDTVWRRGESMKSAFEIEHSTSVYSGILRLADLKARTPNSIYPLFIVADRSRRSKVFDELNRPVFKNPYLQLNEAVRYLSYDSVRKLDEDLKGENVGFDLGWLTEQAEAVSA